MTTRTAVWFRSQTIENRAIGPLVAMALLRQLPQCFFIACISAIFVSNSPICFWVNAFTLALGRRRSPPRASSASISLIEKPSVKIDLAAHRVEVESARSAAGLQSVIAAAGYTPLSAL